MNPEQWQKVSAALDRLLDLDGLRADDPLLCGEVESILGQSQVASHFEAVPTRLEQDARTPGLDSAQAGAVPWPERAGRFLLRGEIARGGMGAVLRAFDPRIERTLAVKVLLPAVRHHPDAVQRFLREAGITGRLQHPGIPPVHDLGQLDDGTPFFAMKLIEGRTLAELLAEAPPTERDTRFIGTFEQVCRTLAYAHSRGVLHRDLKPSNVMVGAFGEVQVMDWGIAKEIRRGETEVTTQTGAIGPPDITQQGDITGTPACMAPEQARGEADLLDERCDVFGLGGLLCAILTGRLPFTGTLGEMLRRAASGDLTEARERLANSGADAELVAIAWRCLEPNREDRYRDASEVAEAVTRYREGVREKLRVAEIEREKAQVKAAEERRRRRLTVVLSGAVVAVFVTGLSLVTWLWLLADSRRVAAENAQSDLKAERDLSDLTARQARDAVRQSFVLAAEDPEFRKDGMQEARRLMLDRALAYFRKFTQQRRDDPALRADLADAHGRIAHVLAERGAPGEALAEYARAAELYEQAQRDGAEQGEAEISLALVQTLNAKAMTERSLGRLGAAAETVMRSLPLAAKLAKEHPTDLRFQLAHANGWSTLGHLRLNTEKAADALIAYREARSILKPLVDAGGKAEALLSAYANVLVSIGHVLKDQHKPADAARLYERAIAPRKQLLAAFPFPFHRSELARAYGSLAYVQGDLGHSGEALQSHRRAIEQRELLARANPKVLDYREELATSYLNYAVDLLGSGKESDALVYRKKALEQFLELTRLAPKVIDYQHRAAFAHVAVSDSCRKVLKQPGQARAHLGEARKIWDALERRGLATSEHRFEAAQCDAQLGLIHLYAREFPEAVREFERSNAAYQSLLEAGYKTLSCQYEVSVNLANMAYCAQEQRRFDDAVRLAVQVVEVREELVRKAPRAAQFQASLKNARSNLAQHGLLYARNTVSPPASPSPAAQREYAREYLAKWQRLARDYPRVAAFRDNVAACWLGVAVAEALLLPTTGEGATAQAKAEWRRAADRVIAALRQARANGFADAKRLQGEKAFAPLRSLPEFQELIGQLK